MSRVEAFTAWVSPDYDLYPKEEVEPDMTGALRGFAHTWESGGTPDDPNYEFEREGGVLSHASDHPFKPGDMVVPPRVHGGDRVHPSVADRDFAYASIPKRSVSFGNDTIESFEENPSAGWGKNLYNVKPVSDTYSWDPNFSGQGIRSRDGFQVINQTQFKGNDSLAETIRYDRANVPPIMRGYNKTMGY